MRGLEMELLIRSIYKKLTPAERKQVFLPGPHPYMGHYTWNRLYIAMCRGGEEGRYVVARLLAMRDKIIRLERYYATR